MAETIANISRNAYVSRVALNSIPNIIEAKKAVIKALKTQIQQLGFSFVELLSPCPTAWNMKPIEALKWMEEKMIPEYPLGEYAVPEGLE
jgi:2-oxoglutarate ferredoxin oxidoreductase subunit beta